MEQLYPDSVIQTIPRLVVFSPLPVQFLTNTELQQRGEHFKQLAALFYQTGYLGDLE